MRVAEPAPLLAREGSANGTTPGKTWVNVAGVVTSVMVTVSVETPSYTALIWKTSVLPVAGWKLKPGGRLIGVATPPCMLTPI